MTDAPGGCQNGLWETGGKIDVETDGGILTSSLGHPIKGLTEVTREASSAHCDSKAFLIRLYHPEVGL